MSFEQDIIDGVADLFSELTPVTATITYQDRSAAQYDEAEGEYTGGSSSESITISPIVPVDEKAEQQYGFEQGRSMCVVQGTEFTSSTPTISSRLTVNSVVWKVTKCTELIPGQSTVAAYVLELER